MGKCAGTTIRRMRYGTKKRDKGTNEWNKI
jgi:hypothetical protein